MAIRMVIFSFLAFLASCASLGGTFDKEKVSKIKRIAVVGFSFDRPMETSNQLLGALMNSDSEAKAQSETPYSKEAYDYLVTNLKKTGWQVKSASETSASPAVKAFYNKAVKVGFHPVEKGSARYEREGIPQYVHVASLAGKGEFAKMARELGVDAIAVALLQANASASIPFVSKIDHTGSVTFQIFDPLSDSLIMLFSSTGKKVEGTTKTKIGKEFEAGVQAGSMAGIDKFVMDITERLRK